MTVATISDLGQRFRGGLDLGTVGSRDGQVWS